MYRFIICFCILQTGTDSLQGLQCAILLSAMLNNPLRVNRNVGIIDVQQLFISVLAYSTFLLMLIHYINIADVANHSSNQSLVFLSLHNEFICYICSLSPRSIVNCNLNFKVYVHRDRCDVFGLIQFSIDYCRSETSNMNLIIHWRCSLDLQHLQILVY